MKFSRCDSENCRALLARYDAPPAHDAANEESSSLQVPISVFLQFFLFYITKIAVSMTINLLNPF